MSTLETLIVLLFGVWATGSILSLVVQNPKFKIQNLLPSAIALYLSINIAWLSNETGVSSVGWDWFTIGEATIHLTFEFTKLTVPLLTIVNVISFLVHVYSVAYMKNDLARSRFFATLGVFTLCMCGLTLSGDLLQLFMFWELVGLSSYLLISFYRDKAEASQAATKAMLINKIGDVGFLIGLMMLWAIAGTLNIESIKATTLSTEWRTLIGTAILLAVLAKSAQFPFHSWLPDAMAGPTPVSALIHSATMVAAGVFLLARLSFLFTPSTLQLAAILGGVTALIGGLNAVRENDLKKFLAWSTLSQLGLMIMVAGGSAFNASFIHLLSHAIFKAGLFLAAGILIQHYHTKSLLGNAIATTPLRVFTIVLTLALMGMPLTIGFFSKEFMLGSIQSTVMEFSILGLSFITAFYCSRLLLFIQPMEKSDEVKSIPRFMLFPVTSLAIASVWFFYSWSPFHANRITEAYQVKESSTLLTFLSIAIIFFGLGAGIFLIKQKRLVSIQNLIPVIPYDNWLKFLFIKPVLILSEITNRSDNQLDHGIHLIAYTKVAFAKFTAWFDQNIVDGLILALAWLSKSFGNVFRKLVTGKIQDYIWWTVAALILILIITSN